MSRGPKRWLVTVAALAVFIELIGVVGWWGWRRLVVELYESPARGAIMLVEDPALRIPSVVRRSRRLPSRELAKAADVLVEPALLSLSARQLRWAPVDPVGFVNRARAKLIEGAIDGGFADLEAAVMRDPRSPGLHRLVALVERSRGRSSEALDHLATAMGLGSGDRPTGLELTPEEEAWVRLEALERRLDYYPRSRAEGVIALAKEYRSRGEDELGREYLGEESDDPRVALELARWDLLEGATPEAERRLLELSRRKGLTSSLLAETWAVMATVRDRQGDTEGAIAAADTAMSYDPRSATPYRVLATLAERRGDMSEALEHLRRAWGMNPTDVRLLMVVARTAEKAGEYDDARLALERAAKVDAASSHVAAALVEFHLRRGDLMDATLALSDALDRFPTDPRLLRLADRLRAEVSRR